MSNSVFTEVTHCRIFPDQALQTFFDLGDQPPANSLRPSLDEVLPGVPLVLAWSEKAKLVQLTATVDPAYLFRHYVWVTGTSKTAREYSKEFYAQFVRRQPLDKESLVVEVASNDGTFLLPFKEGGHRVLGVDPAENIVAEANAAGINSVAEFFGTTAAKTILDESGPAQVVYARNVIPHVPDVLDVVGGMALLLDNGGTGAIEFHYARHIVEELHYDSIYHEHYFYYSIKSLSTILEQVGLYPFDVLQSPISGGSLVLYFKKTPTLPSEILSRFIAEESESGINERSTWESFAQGSKAHADEFTRLIHAELQTGKKLVGYGASARSSTLLNFCRISNEHLECIADKSSHKHNMYTAGSNIKIVAPDRALAMNPDTIVLLAWNFEKEILNELRERGFSGTVIVPLPHSPRKIEI